MQCLEITNIRILLELEGVLAYDRPSATTDPMPESQNGATRGTKRPPQKLGERK